MRLRELRTFRKFAPTYFGNGDEPDEGYEKNKFEFGEDKLILF